MDIKGENHNVITYTTYAEIIDHRWNKDTELIFRLQRFHPTKVAGIEEDVILEYDDCYQKRE